MNWKSYIPQILFLLYFIIGISITKDYGVSWDEDQQMNHGKVSAKEICKKFNLDCPQLMKSKNLPALQDYEQKYYGTFFQLMAIGIDGVFQRESYKERIHTRHYLGFLLFFLGSICFYLLLSARFDKLLSLMGTIIYVTTPRIFAHSFFNPKDTIFLSLFVICLYFLSRFLRDSKHLNLLFLSLFTALMLNARIIGLALFCISLLVILMFNWKLKQNLKRVGLYLLETFVFLFLIWPLLWENTIGNLKDTFSLFSQYPWKGELLYWGTYISSTELPWHYIPSWIMVSTPILFLISILIGLLCLSVEVCRQYKSWFKEFNSTLDWIVLATTLGPLLAIILFQSIVYGGWRHMFFMHAGLVYALVFGLNKLSLHFSKYKKAIFIVVGFAIAINIVDLVRMHPLQNVYFNAFVKNSLENFEQDYWGVSMKEGMEELLEYLPQGQLSKVHAYDYPAWCNYRMMELDKKRLEFVWEKEDADFFIDNFRRKEHIEAFLNKEGLYKDPIHVLYRQGNPVLGIFKLNLDGQIISQ